MYCWSCLLVTLYNDLHLNGPSGTVPDCNTNTEVRSGKEKKSPKETSMPFQRHHIPNLLRRVVQCHATYADHALRLCGAYHYAALHYCINVYNIQARGLCRKHGATGFCASVGCNSYAHARGFCRLHCDRGICSAPDCKSFAQAKGMCRKHGIRTLCSTKGP